MPGPDSKQLQDFQGLPLRSLIVEPLVASSTGQRDLANVTLGFINDLCFSKGKDGKDAVRTVDVEVPRLIEGQEQPLMQKISMPLICMVTIPNLAVDSVSIDFTMEVSTQTKDTSGTTSKHGSESDTTEKAGTSGGFWGEDFSASVDHTSKITGSVSSSSNHTRSTDFSAKYNISVHASQQPPSEGMNRFTEIISSCITPVNTKSS